MRHSALADMRMYRTPEWKLVRDFRNPERDELYHLATDPKENRNLIANPRPDVRSAIVGLHTGLLEKMTELNDPILSRPNEPRRD
jgi:hypothetical protein